MNNEVKNEDERFISLIVKPKLYYREIFIIIILLLFTIKLISILSDNNTSYTNNFSFKAYLSFIMLGLINIIKNLYLRFKITYKKILLVQLITSIFGNLLYVNGVYNFIYFMYVNGINKDATIISKKAPIVLPILFSWLAYLGIKILIQNIFIFNNHKFANIRIINIKKQNSIFTEVTYEFEVDGKVYRNQQIIYTILLYQPMEVDFKVLYNPRFPNFNKIM